MRTIYNKKWFQEFVKTQKIRPFYEFEPFELSLQECLSESAKNTKNINDITAGDVILVNSFQDNKSGEVVDNRDHRIIVITDSGENSAKKRTYFGYSMSSNYKLSNKYNKNFPKRIYVDDYRSIMQDGGIQGKSVCVDMEDLSEFKLSDLNENNWYLGSVSKDFMEFIISTMRDIRTDSDKIICWENGEKVIY